MMDYRAPVRVQLVSTSIALQLIIAAAAFTCQDEKQPGLGEAVATTSLELYVASADPDVHTVYIASSIRMEAGDWQDPLEISRNITWAAAPCVVAAGLLAEVDAAGLTAVAMLSPGVTMTWQSLAFRNALPPTGFLVRVLGPTHGPGTVVLGVNSVIARRAGVYPAVGLPANWIAYRAAGFPGTNLVTLGVAPTCYRSTSNPYVPSCWNASAFFVDVAKDVPLLTGILPDDPGQQLGGYSLLALNVSYIVEHVVSAACYTTARSIEQCILELEAQLDAEAAAATALPPPIGTEPPLGDLSGEISGSILAAPSPPPPPPPPVLLPAASGPPGRAAGGPPPGSGTVAPSPAVAAAPASPPPPPPGLLTPPVAVAPSVPVDWHPAAVLTPAAPGSSPTAAAGGSGRTQKTVVTSVLSTTGVLVLLVSAAFALLVLVRRRRQQQPKQQPKQHQPQPQQYKDEPLQQVSGQQQQQQGPVECVGVLLEGCTSSADQGCCSQPVVTMSAAVAVPFSQTEATVEGDCVVVGDATGPQSVLEGQIAIEVGESGNADCGPPASSTKQHQLCCSKCGVAATTKSKESVWGGCGESDPCKPSTTSGCMQAPSRYGGCGAAAEPSSSTGASVRPCQETAQVINNIGASHVGIGSNEPDNGQDNGSCMAASDPWVTSQPEFYSAGPGTQPWEPPPLLPQGADDGDRKQDASAAEAAGSTLESVMHQLQEARKTLATSGVADNQLTIDRLIGSGHYGTVYLGTWKGLRVAVKTLVFSSTHVNKQRALQEAALCQQISHPCIVATYAVDIQPLVGLSTGLPGSNGNDNCAGVPTTPKQCLLHQGCGGVAAAAAAAPAAAAAAAAGGAAAAGAARATAAAAATATGASGLRTSLPILEWRLLILQEYCDVGPLTLLVAKRWLISRVQGPLMPYILDLAYGIASALAHLHARNIVHGDLTPNNVLLMREPSRPCGLLPKVADFGLSIALPGNTSHMSNHRLGTPFYMAPEVQSKGVVSCRSDTYSLGVILWELYSGRFVCERQLDGSFAQSPAFPAFPPHAPSDYVALCIDCLDADPQRRPAVARVLSSLSTMYRAGTRAATRAAMGAAGLADVLGMPTAAGGAAGIAAAEAEALPPAAAMMDFAARPAAAAVMSRMVMATAAPISVKAAAAAAAKAAAGEGDEDEL